MPLKSVTAKTSGTKWHKDQGGPKQWFEAKTDEGHTYYWHVESHESRWTPPEEGYLSIKEQEDINKKHEAREAKKMEQIYHSQLYHGKQEEETYQKPEPKKNSPFGAWKPVGFQESQSAVHVPGSVDLQTPEVRAKPQANVTLHKDADMKIRQRSTPSLNSGREDSSGISFKKRKMNSEHRKNFRRKGDYDL